MNSILVVEDDPGISSLLKNTLELFRFTPTCVASISEAVKVLNRESFTLIIVDLGLPDGDGNTLLGSSFTGETPVIVLTARDQLQDKIESLDRGADDYVTKPFEVVELIARIKAVLRRFRPEQEVYTFDDIELNIDKRSVRGETGCIDLTPKEFDLLHYLLENGGYAVRREKIIERIWGYDSECTTRTVDIHIQRLRKKLSTTRIETVYKTGYRFNSP